MTMTEQNGIDILCDAAGSDLLLSSLDYLQHGQQSSSSSGANNSNTTTNNTTSASASASASTHPPPIAIISAGGPVPTPSNPLPPPLPDPTSTLHGHQQHQQQAPGPPRAKRPKTESAPPSASASTPTSNHVCQICKRVYERADHLTRHLRSHENARQYQCTRCPKRFNRAYVSSFLVLSGSGPISGLDDRPGCSLFPGLLHFPPTIPAQVILDA